MEECIAVASGQLETNRLILRRHRLGDFKDCAAMWADPAVTRFIGRPHTREESWARLLRYAGHWALLGYGYWAVEEKASGDYIGDVGFSELKRTIEPSIDGLPEMGWVLAARAHGRGYATEAVGAAIAWGEAHLDVARFVCLIHPENHASLRIAEKSGFREYGRATYKEQPAVLLQRFRA